MGRGWAIRVRGTRLWHAIAGRCAHRNACRVEAVVHDAKIVRFVVVARGSAMEQPKIVPQLVHRQSRPRFQREWNTKVSEGTQRHDRIITIDLGAAKRPKERWRAASALWIRL